MQMPVISRPHEPALFARTPGLERHRVAPGGLTVIALEPDDRLEVIDVEGDQRAELLAFAEDGRAALAELGLLDSPDADFIARLLHDGSRESAHMVTGLQMRGIDCRHLPSAARLWPSGTPAGHRLALQSGAALLVIVAAPGGQTAVDSQQRASELRLLIQRANPSSLLVPTLPTPLGEVLDEFTITPGTARDYCVGAGQYIQVIDVAGRQCSDFVAFDRRGLDAGREIDLDPTVTRTLNGNAYPGPGLFSKFFDRNLQPMLEVVRDTVGRHDTFALACTARYYEAQGYFGHANCSDNISRALAAHGVQGRPGWPAINFFFNTGVDAHQQLTLDEPWSRPGDYVLLRAMTDLVCASSSCPDDIDPANGWQPTDIHIRVYAEKERFSIAMANRKTPDAAPVLTRESGFHPGTRALTGHFTDYRGWWTPTQFDGYGTLAEYHACRERVAVMDLSALRKFEILGPDAEALLNYCLTRDVRKLAVGQVVYSAMCYEHGGMLDDGTLLRLGPDAFRWIGGEDFGGEWLRQQAEKLGMKVWIKSASEQIHNIAVQGPLSRQLLKQMIWTPGTQPPLEELGWFRFLVGRLDDYNGIPLMVSRTGYTGELGYEIWCHPSDAMTLWQRLWQLGEPLGLAPLGLHALDMLRIEAGLIFAGYEFSDQTDPYEAGIGFCVPLKSKQDAFIGRDALLRRKEHPMQQLVGLELDGNEIAAHGDCVHVGRAQVGVITSATRSPVLGKNIALCRLAIDYCAPGTRVEIGKLDGQQKRIGACVAAGTVAYDPEKTRVRA
ncbi:MAG: aminomethyltransferase family protein [Gammaproteobacteria bacterium]|nr:aminomethyltransferase family protein [Gammaproteobacteria bacterium]MBU1491664.1 aminomethyltransferase family protein [Gammaproteobacteria bacterium]MBU2140749.1 aminomethyltransferase family protein [Gammaproteobacteria bacterium]MBU2215672.1 aminomethyltransferase family protein [Gammaproteobacteria bacterium]MBU2322391.1 aminomethyltransferase family protein [Gammaproteobacteria bacterium]